MKFESVLFGAAFFFLAVLSWPDAETPIAENDSNEAVMQGADISRLTPLDLLAAIDGDGDKSNATF